MKNNISYSDVLVFLQESSQKYIFVSPENRIGIVPVHTLLAKVQYFLSHF